MFRTVVGEIPDAVEIVQERFICAASKGHLEPIFDDNVQVTRDSWRGFNNKQATALRGIIGMPMSRWSRDEVLAFSNEALMVYLKKIGYNAD